MIAILRPLVIIGALPVTLLNGTTADATQVMSDLNFIVNQVNSNASALATAAVTNANNNFTTVQSGQPANQPANFPIASQVQNEAFNTLSSILGTNTITARVASLTLGAYGTGQIFTFVAAQQNTGPVTLNIDGVGARSILNMGSALTGAELRTGLSYAVDFNANENAFDLLNSIPYIQGPNVPSAATLNLDAQFGDYHKVDGTINITALTLSQGKQKLLEFNSSPLVSHSSSLLLLGSASITPFPGDLALFRGEASGVVRMTGYAPVDLQPLRGPSGFGRPTQSFAWGTGLPTFGKVTKRKTADQSVTTSVAPQNDNHLVFPIGANEEWVISYELSADETDFNGSGVFVAIAGPAGSTGELFGSAPGVSTDSNRSKRTTNLANGISFAATDFTAGTLVCELIVRLNISNSSTPGTVQLQWGQATSSGTLTIHKGSFLEATRVA